MKSTTLYIRVQPELRAQIEARAKAAGLPVSAYMRRAAVDARVTVVTTPRIADEQWVELGSALTSLRSAVKLLEGRRGEGEVDTLLNLVAEVDVMVTGIRGMLLQ